MSTSNMIVTGGGNVKSCTSIPSHFRIWKHTPQRRKQVRKGKEHYGLGAPISLPKSLGLWSEWLPTPYFADPNTGEKLKGAYPSDISIWLNQLNQFMKTYKSKTLVFRIQAPKSGSWSNSVDYNNWLEL